MKKIVRTVRVEETVTYKDLLKDIRLILQEEKKTPQKENLDCLFTPAETAAIFKISKRSLHNWSEKGILRKLTVGNRVFYRKKDIEELIERNSR